MYIQIYQKSTDHVRLQVILPLLKSFNLLKPNGELNISHENTTMVVLFQNNYQQDDTYGLSFISGVVVLHSICFELQGAHQKVFSF